MPGRSPQGIYRRARVVRCRLAWNAARRDIERSMDRRDLLARRRHPRRLGAARPVLGRAPSLMAQPALGPAQPFDWDWLKAQARDLATQPFETPGDQRPPQLAELTWDQYEALRFRPDHALWADTDLPFRVQFFHLGSYYQAAVRIFVVDQRRGAADRVRPQPVRLRPDHASTRLCRTIWASPAGACTSTPTSRRTSPSSWAPPISAPPTPATSTASPAAASPSTPASSRAGGVPALHAASGWSGRARPTPP